MAMRNNIILNVDSYKTSHFCQYPEGTTAVSSYIESRGGKFDKTVFFGLQMFIKEYLLKPFTLADIDEAEELLIAHGLPFNRSGWEYILGQYQGYLPLEIQAVPEGTVLDTKNVLVQIVNTDPRCAWLTSYIETAILRAVWYPTTVATNSWVCKKVIERNLGETSDSVDGLMFKLHDFGSRGVSSAESAAIGGLAHLVNFTGTDTLAAILAARKYYNENMAGFSIPAAEHSTVTSWGRENEGAAYLNMLNQFSEPGKMVAVVSDSYNLWNAIDNIWGGELKEIVENKGGTLVVRPDSGDPVEIVSGTIERLMAKFGYSTNSKGYKVLPSCVRVIQGDGIELSSLEDILKEMKRRNLSTENIAFGMGGALLQQVNRDTQKFAMKASAVEINGNWIDVYKDPVTDPGKKSKRGKLALVKEDSCKWKTIRFDELDGRNNLLRTVYLNGSLVIDDDLSVIRKRTA